MVVPAGVTAGIKQDAMQESRGEGTVNQYIMTCNANGMDEAV